MLDNRASFARGKLFRGKNEKYPPKRKDEPPGALEWQSRDVSGATILSVSSAGARALSVRAMKDTLSTVFLRFAYGQWALCRLKNKFLYLLLIVFDSKI